MNKISICTVCMNRTNYLCETLLVNINENNSHPDVEFVLLDYNSKDGLEDWAKIYLRDHIQTGRVKYFKTYEPEYFSMTHSKNMAVRLASGNINCIIDADNYAGPGYVNWVDSIFDNSEKNAVVTTLRTDLTPYRDQGGKIGFRKDHFCSVRGFNESFTSHGFDDVDIVNRLEQAGGTRVFIEKEEYLKYIGHSNTERLNNYYLANNLAGLYLSESISGIERRGLYMLKDNRFFEVYYEFDKQLEKSVYAVAGWAIKKDGQREGAFERTNNMLTLTFDNGLKRVYHDEGNQIKSYEDDEESVWKKIEENDSRYPILIIGYGECKNRLMYKQSMEKGGAVNENGWGRGAVYLNFDTSNPIIIG